MKKHLIFAAAIVAALTFAACGGKSNTPAPAADSTEAVADTTAAAALEALDPEMQQAVASVTGAVGQALEKKDAKAVTTALADIAATYKALVNAGKLDEAKNYASAVKSFVTSNAGALKSLAADGEADAATTISNLVTSVTNLPTAASATAEEAKAAVTQDVVNLASPYIQKGAAAKATAEAAAEAIKNAPQSVKDAAASVVSGAEEKVSSAAETAVSNAESQAKAAVNKEVEKGQKKASEAVEKTQKKANDAVNKAAGKALKGLGL